MDPDAGSFPVCVKDSAVKSTAASVPYSEELILTSRLEGMDLQRPSESPSWAHHAGPLLGNTIFS